MRLWPCCAHGLPAHPAQVQVPVQQGKVGPEGLHLSQACRWCCCCRSKDHTWRNGSVAISLLLNH